MKKLFLPFIAALFSLAAYGTTLNPIQLLNPAGSASGQAIVSTGASSAPAWGGVGVNGIAPIAANTVLANATGSSANPTAFAMPSCSTSASALNWTTSTGFTCNTAVNAAQLSGNAIGTSGATIPLLNGVNTWSGAQTFTSSITPSQTNGIVGTTTNNNANAGSVGEFVTSTVTSAAIASATVTNVTSISLTAGDWDVWGNTVTIPAGSTTQSFNQCGISTTSATYAAPPGYTILAGLSGGILAGNSVSLIAPLTRLSLASTTTVFLVATVTYATSTLTIDGTISARRVR